MTMLRTSVTTWNGTLWKDWAVVFVSWGSFRSWRTRTILVIGDPHSHLELTKLPLLRGKYICYKKMKICLGARVVYLKNLPPFSGKESLGDVEKKETLLQLGFLFTDEPGTNL